MFVALLLAAQVSAGRDYCTLGVLPGRNFWAGPIAPSVILSALSSFLALGHYGVIATLQSNLPASL